MKIKITPKEKYNAVELNELILYYQRRKSPLAKVYLDFRTAGCYVCEYIDKTRIRLFNKHRDMFYLIDKDHDIWLGTDHFNIEEL